MCELLPHFGVAEGGGARFSCTLGILTHTKKKSKNGEGSFELCVLRMCCLAHICCSLSPQEERTVTAEEKAQAELFKDRGNAAFKEGKFREAAAGACNRAGPCAPFSSVVAACALGVRTLMTVVLVNACENVALQHGVGQPWVLPVPCVAASCPLTALLCCGRLGCFFSMGTQKS